MYSNSLELCFGVLESETAFSFHLQFQISFNALLIEPSLSVWAGVVTEVHRSFSCWWGIDAKGLQIPQILRKCHWIGKPPYSMVSPHPDFLILVPAYPSGLVLWPLVFALLIKIPPIPYLFLNYVASKIWPTHPTSYRLNISVVSPNQPSMHSYSLSPE